MKILKNNIFYKINKKLEELSEGDKLTEEVYDRGEKYDKIKAYRAYKKFKDMSKISSPTNPFPDEMDKPEGYDEYELQEKAKEDAEKSKLRHLGVASMESLIKCL